ncbi:hypothetical protein V8E36_006114 [Tilletia maclaganii]
MGKSDDQVIEEFNEYINMSADELESWLESDDSKGSGWGGEGGETVGHNSGTKIVDILRRNPDKDPEKYTEDDLAHMRKVASYCKRHLAQEDKLKESKSREELEEAKSTKSLKMTLSRPSEKLLTTLSVSVEKSWWCGHDLRSNHRQTQREMAGKDKDKDKAAAAAAELDAIQAQLERSQNALADSIMAKLGAPATSASTNKSNGKGGGAPKQQQSSHASNKKDKQSQREKLLSTAAPRNSHLGLGAVLNAAPASHPQALNEADARLKGRLVSKRKRAGDDGNDHAALNGISSESAQAQDKDGKEEEEEEEEEAGRSGAVASRPPAHTNGPANDIFAKAAKKQKKNNAQAGSSAPASGAAAATTTTATAESGPNETEHLTKAQRRNRRKKAKQEAERQAASTQAAPSSSTNDAESPPTPAQPTPPAQPTSLSTPAPAPAPTIALTPLQKSMSQKLSGARFRTINETLYTTDSAAAVELMRREPATLGEYHSGFREQVKGWPKNPVDVLARRIANKGGGGGGAKQQQQNGSDSSSLTSLVIADLGAGEAPLQLALQALDATRGAKVLSYDLLTSPDGRVIGADCARFPFGVPLPGDPATALVPTCVRRAMEAKAQARLSVASSSNGGKGGAKEGGGVARANAHAVVDVVVFCLSLMPTNWVDMILEAKRILREGGELYIAEVASRFNTLDKFVSILERAGFKLIDKDDSNTHFTILHLRVMKDAAVWSQWKAEKGADWEEALQAAEADQQAAYVSPLVEEGSTILKPCLYKRR